MTEEIERFLVYFEGDHAVMCRAEDVEELEEELKTAWDAHTTILHEGSMLKHENELLKNKVKNLEQQIKNLEEMMNNFIESIR